MSSQEPYTDDPFDTSINVKRLGYWLRRGDYPGKIAYDCSFYTNQPDLRPYGFTPQFLCYDGNLNRYDPLYDNRNSYPDFSTPTIQSRIEAAYRYSARAAAGLVNLAHHNISEAVAYRNIKRASLCYNLEDTGFTTELDAYSVVNSQATRQDLLARMTTTFQWVRDQWTTDFVTDIELGIYWFPPPFYSGNPNNAGYSADIATASQDFIDSGLIDLLDAFYPEGPYLYTENVSAWITSLELRLSQLASIDNTKPVYVFMAPHYAQAGPSLNGLPIPRDKWRQVVDAIMQRTDGIIMWGGLDGTAGGDPSTPLVWGS